MSKARITSALALVLAATLLAGCSGDDSSDASEKSSGSASASPYLPVPDGVELTPQGSELKVGEAGTVAFEPRQDEVGVLDLNVTKMEQTTVRQSLSAWQLTPAQKNSTPYFVHVSVKNVGETDLGGRRVPLYAVNQDDLLLESTPFASSFEACPSTALPEKFGPGAAADMCLVYLAPDRGTISAISFRPEETFDPITWTGEITKYVAPKPKKKKKK